MENNEKEVLFSVSHLKKYFQVGNHATLKAVDDVSFEINRGEVLGVRAFIPAHELFAADPLKVSGRHQ